MNGWLWAATILSAALLPLIWCCAARPPAEGVVALQVCGAVAAAILLCLAEGTARQLLGDVALVSVVTSFVGTLALLRFLERVR